jgi:hypothetical protein
MPPTKKLKKKRFVKVIKKAPQAEFSLKAKDLPEIFESISIRRKRKPRPPKEKVGTMPMGEKKSGASYQTFIPQRASNFPTAPSYIPIQSVGTQTTPQLTKSDIQSVFTASLEDLARGYKQIGENKSISQPIPSAAQNSLTAVQIQEILDYDDEEEEEKSFVPEQPLDKPPVPSDNPRVSPSPKPKAKIEFEIEDEDIPPPPPQQEFMRPERKNTSAQAIRDLQGLSNKGATEKQIMSYLAQYKVRHKTQRDVALLIVPDLIKIADDLKAKYSDRTFSTLSKAILEKL